VILTDLSEQREALARLVAEAGVVAGFTGAGISTECGIPDFRSPGSPWLKNKPIDFDLFVSSEEMRREAWRRKFVMDDLYNKGARPGRGHRALAALAASGKMPTLITQNIDGLHQASGSTRVFEIHGSALRVRCHHHCGFIELWQAGQLAPRQCPSCGARARPDVVWFGEALDEEVFSHAAEAAIDADIFITVGTSAIIQPAASLPVAAKEYGALIVEVNPHATPFSEHADYSIRAGASEFFPALCAVLFNGI